MPHEKKENNFGIFKTEKYLQHNIGNTHGRMVKTCENIQ